jgi:hypothetical protein
VTRLVRDGWTVNEASADFAMTGKPIPPRQLAMIIRALPAFNPLGETASGGRGGRGHALYDIGQLQRLHSALAPWLHPPVNGDT